MASLRTLCLALALLPSGAALAQVENDVDRWVGQLRSDKPSQFRIAQAYLARPASDSLDELDQISKASDGRLKQRLKEVVALMLLNGIDSRELQRHCRLYNVCKPEFDQARKLTKRLKQAVKAAKQENPDATEGVQWYFWDDQASDWVLELFHLHGWSMPALLDIIRDKKENPFLRMVAIDLILVSHGGRLPEALFERLRKDQTPLVRSYGDYAERSTIGKAIESIIKTRPQLTEKESFADYHRCLDLLHQFQGVKKGGEKHVLRSFDSTWSCDEYWAAAQREMERLWDEENSSCG